MKKIIIVSTCFCFSAGISAADLTQHDINQITGPSKTVMVFDGTAGDFISGGKTKIFTSLSVQPVYGDWNKGVEFSMLSDSSYFYATFAAGDNQKLQKGDYTSAERFPFQSPSHPGLDISGDGRGCNKLRGKFVIRDIHYSQSGELQDIAVDFIQHCEGQLSYLSGALRYHSNIPINFNISD